MKLKKLKQRSIRHLKGLLSAWRDSGTAAKQHGRSRFALLGEAATLALRGRMGVDTYFHYRFFDPKLTADAKRRYLSEAPGANARLWSALTPTRYRLLFANKLVFNRYFGSLGLPLAELFGVFDPVAGRTVEGESLRTEAELGALMRRLRQNGFVFKPAEGVRGHLTLVLTGGAKDDPDAFMSLAGERYDAAAIIAATRNTTGLELQSPTANVSPFLIEERIRPHPELAEFIGPTLCSVRVVTIVARNGKPQIVASVFKLQPKPIGVDHLMYGALACWVDPETGALGYGRTRTSYDQLSLIPGTDRNFVGFRLPYWKELKEVALEAAMAFPWARAIGWDIATSDRGPIILEGNDSWSPSLVQLPAPHGLMDGELKELYDSLRRRNGRT